MKREELLKKLEGLENVNQVVDYIMAENGKDINKYRSEVEVLKTEKEDLVKNHNTETEKYKDYETLKTKNLEYETELKAFKTKAQKEPFLKALSNAKIDDDFTDVVLKKLEFNDDSKIEEFQKKLETFVKENPKYTTEKVETRNTNSNYFGNGKTNYSYDELTKMTDEEYFAATTKQKE